jgi:beta-1,4-mannosyltransferase
MMKIVFDPTYSSGNQYVNLITAELRKSSHEVQSLNYALKNPGYLWSADVIHLNWFEDLMGSSRLQIFLFFMRQSSKLLLLLLMGKKIVWTLHNKVSHEEKYRFYNNLMVRMLTRCCKAIVVHSNISRAFLMSAFGVKIEKTYYVPHPNYIDAYGPVQERPEKVLENHLTILFIGALKPYKNVELLIEVARGFASRNIRFQIIGKPLNAAYAASLKALTANLPKVTLDFSFVKDEDLGGLLANADVMVFPYDLKSSLNSGSVFLAFSYRKTVICPAIGSLLDFENQDAFFTYKYMDPASHLQELKKQIEKVYEIWEKDKTQLINLGNLMYETVKIANAPELVRKKLEAIYEKIN